MIPKHVELKGITVNVRKFKVVWAAAYLCRVGIPSSLGPVVKHKHTYEVRHSIAVVQVNAI